MGNYRNPAEKPYTTTRPVALPLFEQVSCGPVEGGIKGTAAGIPQAPTRRGMPATSFEAAKSVTNLGRTKDRILSVLRNQGPMTDEQLWDYFERFVDFPVSPSGLRTRRSWLVDHGFVVDSGQRAKTAAKRDSIVWRAA